MSAEATPLVLVVSPEGRTTRWGRSQVWNSNKWDGTYPGVRDEYANKLNRHSVQWVDKMYAHRQCALARQGG